MGGFDEPRYPEQIVAIKLKRSVLKFSNEQRTYCRWSMQAARIVVKREIRRARETNVQILSIHLMDPFV